MKLNNETKPDSLKGIKNKKEVIKIIHKHSEHPVDSEFSMNDGTMYKVRADGAWVRI